MKPSALIDQLERFSPAQAAGRINRIGDGVLEASGPEAGLADLCLIEWVGSAGTRQELVAEVIGVDRSGICLNPLRGAMSVPIGARVVAESALEAKVGDGLAGRALDALGEPLDGGAAVHGPAVPLAYSIPAPLERVEPDAILNTGIRALDGLLTLGVGQRVGIFAASGVGKTSLVEQLMAQVDCDRVVLCLVGERGREVKGLWRTLGARDDAERFTLIAATSDESASLRVRAVNYALAAAEWWRSRGEHVVLFVDSVTRLAMALREIGLAAGAPPTVRAYTPNVFSTLPKVVEQCGAVQGGGAITALFTVLSETDDVDDPIVELMKSLLDGHIVLSRILAEQDHFPAIDVVRSVSRQSDRRVTAEHQRFARGAIASLATYDEARVMIESGVYKAGSNPAVDRAIAQRPALLGYLRQPRDQNAPFDTAVTALKAIGTARAAG